MGRYIYEIGVKEGAELESIHWGSFGFGRGRMGRLGLNGLGPNRSASPLAPAAL